MTKLPKFFDWHGELGRYDYFVECIKHGSVYLLVLFIYAGICFAFGWEPILDHSFSVFDQYIHDGFMVTASTACFVPIYIKRARDLGMSPWWVAAFEALSLFPEPPEGYQAHWAAYNSLVLLPLVIYLLILQFKPGKAHREHTRTSTRSQKITFSG